MSAGVRLASEVQGAAESRSCLRMRTMQSFCLKWRFLLRGQRERGRNRHERGRSRQVLSVLPMRRSRTASSGRIASCWRRWSSYAWEKPYCFPGNSDLAKKSGRSERQVKRTLGEMQEAEIVYLVYRDDVQGSPRIMIYLRKRLDGSLPVATERPTIQQAMDDRYKNYSTRDKTVPHKQPLTRDGSVPGGGVSKPSLVKQTECVDIKPMPAKRLSATHKQCSTRDGSVPTRKETHNRFVKETHLERDEFNSHAGKISIRSTKRKDENQPPPEAEPCLDAEPDDGLTPGQREFIAWLTDEKRDILAAMSPGKRDRILARHEDGFGPKARGVSRRPAS